MHRRPKLDWWASEPPAITKPLKFFRAGGDAAQVVRHGLLQGLELVIGQSGRELALAVPQRGTLEGVIEEVLGAKVVRALLRNGQDNFHGLQLVLVTQRNSLSRAMPVLACFTNAKHTNELVRSSFTSALVLLPWTVEDEQQFERAYTHATALACVDPVEQA